MAWGAFSAQGKVDLVPLQGKCNSEKYCEMLSNDLLPCLDEEFIAQPYFQQGNARIHVSRFSKRWVSEHNVELLDWPSLSPDLNPMENMWAILSHKVYENGKQHDNKGELLGAIMHHWEQIGQWTLDKLASSMSKRLVKVIKQNGSVVKRH